MSNMLPSVKRPGANTLYHRLLHSHHLQRGRGQQCLSYITVVVSISALLVLPATACSKPGYEVRPGGIKLVLPVDKRDNYVISVSANERQRVQFTVDGPSSETEYTATGRVSSRHIKATFGALGRINVRLHLVPYPPDPPHKGRCKGHAPFYQEGSYSGTIKFAQQGQAPRVSAEGGHVYFTRYFRQVCKSKDLLPEPRAKNKLTRRIEAGFLTVSGKGEGRTVLLEAFILRLRGNPARSRGGLTAVVNERNEDMRITKTTFVPLDTNSFTMGSRNAMTKTVNVDPPAPFVGHALYSSSSGSFPSWTGDLSVNLPGTGTVHLTGSGLSAVFCRSSWARLDDCIPLQSP